MSDLKPGPVLDALIAEKVMKGKRHLVNSVLAVDVSAKSYTIGEGWEYPRYSTSIEAAWEVVEKLKSSQFSLSRYVPMHEKNFYRAYIGESGACDADTAPHAICLAALKAVDFK